MMQESDYVSFQQACAMLAERLKASREEVGLWAWLGKRCGGIATYSSPRPSICSKADSCIDFNRENCRGFAPSPLYAHIPDHLEQHTKPWAWVIDAYFLRREIASFNPSQVGRYITWDALVARWKAYGLDENEVLNKARGRIHDDELTDMAPLFGTTEIGSETGAPASWAMFPLADIEAIEARDFPGSEGGVEKVSGGGTATPEEPETNNWILLIQAEAAKRWKLLREAGANPTKNNIKDDLAKWCRDSHVATDGGINPTAEYIYRHVLQKWTPPMG